MLEKDAQQNEEATLTESFIHDSVTHQCATRRENFQLLDHKETWITTFFLLAERALPLVTKYICLILATVNYIYTHDMLTTIFLIGITTGTFSVQEAVKMLLRYKQSRRMDYSPEGVSPVDIEVPRDKLLDQSGKDSKE